MSLKRRIKKIFTIVVRKKESNAMIVVERVKKRYFRNLKTHYIPHDSFEKEYEGQWLHIVGLDTVYEDGKAKLEFWTIKPRKHAQGKSPTDAFIALNCADEVAEYYGLSMPTMQKIKIGILVGLCIGILITIFLIIPMAGGG